jgi:hypothetical protein
MTSNTYSVYVYVFTVDDKITKPVINLNSFTLYDSPI